MLFAKQVWKIIGHLGGFNGAALMESFSCTALHFITSVCQLYLIYKVSKGQRMWSINLWVGDCTREKRGWRDISFINMAGCPSIIPCRIGVSHFSHYSYQERPLPGIRRESAWVCMSACDLYKKVAYITTLEFSRGIVLFYRWDSSLTIPLCQKSVFTQMVCIHPGPYMNAIKLAEYKDFVRIE